MLERRRNGRLAKNSKELQECLITIYVTTCCDVAVQSLLSLYIQLKPQNILLKVYLYLLNTSTKLSTQWISSSAFRPALKDLTNGLQLEYRIKFIYKSEHVQHMKETVTGIAECRTLEQKEI